MQHIPELSPFDIQQIKAQNANVINPHLVAAVDFQGRAICRNTGEQYFIPKGLVTNNMVHACNPTNQPLFKDNGDPVLGVFDNGQIYEIPFSESQFLWELGLHPVQHGHGVMPQSGPPMTYGNHNQFMPQQHASAPNNYQPANSMSNGAGMVTSQYSRPKAEPSQPQVKPIPDEEKPTSKVEGNISVRRHGGKFTRTFLPKLNGETPRHAVSICGKVSYDLRHYKVVYFYDDSGKLNNLLTKSEKPMNPDDHIQSLPQNTYNANQNGTGDLDEALKDQTQLPDVVNDGNVIIASEELKEDSSDCSVYAQALMVCHDNNNIPMLIPRNFVRLCSVLPVDENVAQMAEDLSKGDTAHDKLELIHDIMDFIDGDFFVRRLINRKMTEWVNIAFCRVGLNDLRIDSFEEDYEEVKKALTKNGKYGFMKTYFRNDMSAFMNLTPVYLNRPDDNESEEGPHLALSINSYILTVPNVTDEILPGQITVASNRDFAMVIKEAFKVLRKQNETLSMIEVITGSGQKLVVVETPNTAQMGPIHHVYNKDESF